MKDFALFHFKINYFGCTIAEKLLIECRETDQNQSNQSSQSEWTQTTDEPIKTRNEYM